MPEPDTIADRNGPEIAFALPKGRSLRDITEVELVGVVPGGGRVAVSLQAAAWLAESALDQLWDARQDDGCCCPDCCGPCAALEKLLEADQLDALSWWVTDHLGRSGVDRDWLRSSWKPGIRHAETGA
jgi:hypothetical protein